MTVIVSSPTPPDLLERIAARHPVIQLARGELPQLAVPTHRRAEVRGLLCTMRLPVDAALLDAFPGLEVVSVSSVGHDNVDVALASRRGVLVCNTPGVSDSSVADLTMGLVLCLARQLFAMDRFVREGRWLAGLPPLGSHLGGKRIGLLGMGRIGRQVAQRARAFGMDVCYHNRRRDPAAEDSGLARWVERDTLFSHSDFVSLHLPLNPETQASVGARELGLMRSSAFLVNTARGGVVDEAALVDHLRQGRIAGAGLDVMAHEPLSPDHPLCQLPQVVLQPHAGSATVEVRRAMIEMGTRNLLEALAGGCPAAAVNPEVRNA